MSRKCRVFTIFVSFFLGPRIAVCPSFGLCTIFPYTLFPLAQILRAGLGAFMNEIYVVLSEFYTFNAAKEQGMPLVEGSPVLTSVYMGTWDITFAGWDVRMM